MKQLTIFFIHTALLPSFLQKLRTASPDEVTQTEIYCDCQKVLSYLPQTICVHHISRLQL